MKKILLASIPIVSSIFFASAQIVQNVAQNATTNNFGPITKLIATAQNVFNKLVPIAIGLGLVGFLFFLAMFIWKGADNPIEQKKAKEGIMWSIIALFVMVSIWGIIILLASILGVSIGGKPLPFKLPGEL